MKKLLFILLASLAFSGAFADVNTTSQSQDQGLIQKEQCQQVLSADKEQVAQRGCCSWQQGVCGCQGGRVVCCDGSNSPSCTCNTEDPPIVPN
ncbi:hypothetical protein [Sulfuricella denitrificans]|uniref:hypothetical protein n=1 Tax=Sulfuricella denitrificans TaxID=649841 RepID=UPI0011D1C85D|nr:hypothetical protein [Sulfuricella denitrificans]